MEAASNWSFSGWAKTKREVRIRAATSLIQDVDAGGPEKVPGLFPGDYWPGCQLSSAEGPYMPGIGMLFSRRYTPSWARW